MERNDEPDDVYLFNVRSVVRCLIEDRVYIHEDFAEQNRINALRMVESKIITVTF